MDSHWEKVEEAVCHLIELPANARRTWLDEFCNGEDDLRAEIDSLLESHLAAGEFLEHSAAPYVAGLLKETVSSPAPEKIGQYRIRHELGRGGMGVVYLGEREDQFHQQVAIKVVKRGLDTEDILRRFHNERQILASLNHPNIAKIFDGGMTEDGLPYFVMEYIDGEPLTKYCDAHDLSIEERLDLFRRASAAVQHAHQNLIVHRDLKPSNILVMPDREVKLLDFGVAKMLSSDSLDGAATMTLAAQRIMTPEYASPEQVRGLRVTTATDVYSLGVVLYELLTGTKPYELKDTTPEELSRAICESEPSKPSDAARDTQTGGHGDAEKERASLRRRIPASGLKGDLDNIVLMALRKEPERRYKSVEQFSEDIRRHLAGLPVIARKDTLAYRTSKYLQRNKIAVASAALIALAIIAGFIGTVWQARVARAQARLAQEQRDRAQAAQARAEKINAFMQTIFGYANPAWFGRAGGRRDMSVLEAMRDVEKRIDTEFKDEPDLRADVYQQIGDAYRTQGLYEDAERNLRKALALRLELYGEDNAKVAESMYILCGVRHAQGDMAEHERLLTKALSIQRRHPDEGNNLPYMIRDYAGHLAQYKNDYAGALALDREALEMFRRRYGESHLMSGLIQAGLVIDYASLGDYTQAETIAAIVQERFKQPLVLSLSLPAYAFIKTVQGNYPAADDAIKQMLVLAQSKDAPPRLLMDAQAAQSFLAYRQGDYAQAKVYAERTLAAAQASGDHLYSNVYPVSSSLNKLGQAKRAETLLRAEIARLQPSERVFDLAMLKGALGESLTMQRRYAEAETLLLEAYETQKARVLPQEYHLSGTRQRLAELYRAWAKPDEARKFE